MNCQMNQKASRSRNKSGDRKKSIPKNCYASKIKLLQSIPGKDEEKNEQAAIQEEIKQHEINSNQSHQDLYRDNNQNYGGFKNGIQYHQNNNAMIHDHQKHYLHNISQFLQNQQNAQQIINVQSGMNNQSNNPALISMANNQQIIQKKMFERQEKNRQSAKNSRKRKKIYIELLEKNFQQVTNQLERAKQMIHNKNKNNQNIPFNFQLINEIYNERQQLQNKLENLLHKGGNDGQSDRDISLIIDSLRLRQSNNGTDRQTTLKILYDFLYQNILPKSSEYLLEVSTQNLDIFDRKFDGISESKYYQMLYQFNQELSNGNQSNSMNNNNNNNNVILKLNLNYYQFIKLRQFQSKLQQQFQQYKIVMENFELVKKQIKKQNIAFQQVIDDIRNNLNPSQTGNYILEFLNQQQVQNETPHQITGKKPKLFFKRKSDDESNVKLEEPKEEFGVKVHKKIHIEEFQDVFQ